VFRKGHVPHNAKHQPDAPPAAEPVTRESSAEQRLVELLAEQAEIQRELTEHREQRQRWLTDGGDLGRITELATGDDKLRLRVEQVDALLPAAQQAVRQEQAAVRQARWHALAPDLELAMLDTANAIRAYGEASERYRKLHFSATQQGYSDELRERFITPTHALHNPYVFENFVTAVERCQQRQQAVGVEPAIVLEAGDAPPFHPPRFVPRRVSVAEVERISAIAPPQRVRIVHGPVRTANLQIGIARMHPGETHIVSARAAYALTASGVAEFADEPATAPAA
jgi:hypothetical protein